MQQPSWKLERVSQHEADFDTRAVLQVTKVKGEVLVTLHLPNTTFWSDPMSLPLAVDLIERDRKLIPIVASIHVIDNMELWPADWPRLQ